jgi:hypothetical protein
MAQAANAIEKLNVFNLMWQESAKIALEAEPKWIPVTERLPSENGLYFCCWKALCNDKSWIIRLATWRADTGWMNMSDEPMKKPITHWMPLPEPPEEVTDGTT